MTIDCIRWLALLAIMEQYILYVCMFLLHVQVFL